MQVEEQRGKVITIIEKSQGVSKINFDQNLTSKEFVKDLYVLLWNNARENPSMHNAFEALWICPS